MRNLVIFNKAAASHAHESSLATTVQLHGVPVTIGLINTPDTRFDSRAPHRLNYVLVRVRAISCSYRDQSVILDAALRTVGEEATPIGTEFIAEVLAVGGEVNRFSVGDRVLPVAYWPEDTAAARTPRRSRLGLPTQRAGRELCVFDEDELLRAPDSMSDEIAASFTTCAQTAYAMVRKSGAQRGNKVLVTAPNSSTSLYIISALAALGAEIFAVTTSNRHEARLRELGVQDLAVIDPHSNDAPLPVSFGAPECVFDPYADLYLAHAVRWLATGGVYVTCGVVDQHYKQLLQKKDANLSFDPTETFSAMVGKNLRIIGSCLGVPKDLENAVTDYLNGKLRCIVDSTFSGEQVGDYLRRSFDERDRFGKVVYRF